ncbi:MAG: ATP-binding cassette domain-containing protein [Gammaproteobacteria bacterium]
MSDTLIELSEVGKDFETGLLPWTRRRIRAVDSVSLALRQGQTFGIVGESGSGKSTVLRLMLRLLRPSRGAIYLQGRDISSLDGSALKAMRRRVQAVFQDPASSFNPRQNVGAILRAPLEVHNVGTRATRRARAGAALEQVGLDASFGRRYPHQLSGGQRQRVAIARAIVLGPELLIADEPTSALDVSVQAQILNLFKQTKRELGLTCVFVSHNLGVIRYVSDRVAVMRAGRIVEMGSSQDVFTSPQHEYTQALLAAVPDVGHVDRGHSNT